MSYQELFLFCMNREFERIFQSSGSSQLMLFWGILFMHNRVCFDGHVPTKGYLMVTNKVAFVDFEKMDGKLGYMQNLIKELMILRKLGVRLGRQYLQTCVWFFGTLRLKDGLKLIRTASR